MNPRHLARRHPRYRLGRTLGVAVLAAVAVFGWTGRVSRPPLVPETTTTAAPRLVEVRLVPVAAYTSTRRDVGLEEVRKLRLHSAPAAGKEKGERGTAIVVPREHAEIVAHVLDLDERDLDAATLLPSAQVADYLQANPSAAALLVHEDADFRLKTLSVDGQIIWDRGRTDSYPLKDMVPATRSMTAFNPSEVRSLTFVGDIMLSRTVAKRMAQRGSLYPFEATAAELRAADLSIANLESALSDRVRARYSGMSFVAPSKAVAGLRHAGLDVIALANNHTTNFGTTVLLDTLSVLQKNGITYVGAGKDIAEARRPAILNVRGLRFAFLDYNSITGAIDAGPKTPGVAGFSIKPWSKSDDPEDIAAISRDVAAARKLADVVIPMFHWGVEYTPKPIGSQSKVAHAAIDAGADMVVGTHPHVVQAVEAYQGRFIAYSLGNFVFDQEWSLPTKQGVVLRTIFYGKKLVSAELVPVLIEDYCRPRILEPAAGRPILDRIFSVSAPPF